MINSQTSPEAAINVYIVPLQHYAITLHPKNIDTNKRKRQNVIILHLKTDYQPIPFGYKAAMMVVKRKRIMTNRQQYYKI